MIMIKFGRRSVSMGDDVNNGIYSIELPDEATLGVLIKVVRHGWNGNTWSIPCTSTVWNIYTNIGKIADLIPENESIVYSEWNEDVLLSSLGITWVYGCHEEQDVDIKLLERSYFR